MYFSLLTRQSYLDGVILLYCTCHSLYEGSDLREAFVITRVSCKRHTTRICFRSQMVPAVSTLLRLSLFLLPHMHLLPVRYGINVVSAEHVEDIW